MCNFVESDIKVSDVRSSVAQRHSHTNRTVLDGIVSDGLSTKYLGADGEYHDVPALFSVSEFLLFYNQVSGNVKAASDNEGKLVLNTTNSFAYQTSGRVIGEIEVASAGGKQLNVSIAEVDVNTGAVTENPIHYVRVGNGLSVGFSEHSINIGFVPSEEPFLSKMDKQPLAAIGNISTFGADGQLVDSGVGLADLATGIELSTHAQDAELHVTQQLQNAWSGKQSALTSEQLAAVNSGITAGKVSAYDNYATNKLSKSGHAANKSLETDGSGEVVTVDKFDPDTKISKVPTAGVNRVAVFDAVGGVMDSTVSLGHFQLGQTVRSYIDTSIASNISGSSYRGTYTYFGTAAMVTSVVSVQEGATAIVYELGESGELISLERGVYESAAWSFTPVLSPVGGNWFEFDHLLPLGSSVQGRVIVRMDGITAPTLDVRPVAALQYDGVTVELDNNGNLAFKQRTLSSGKAVLNATSADSIAFDFGEGSVRTIKEVLDAILSELNI